MNKQRSFPACHFCEPVPTAALVPAQGLVLAACPPREHQIEMLEDSPHCGRIEATAVKILC